ncbi:MAG: Outer rane efflux protein [Gemmataceae bacterium]|nr:Outer rane efflux protein [Gemmataceae bacterium]
MTGSHIGTLRARGRQWVTVGLHLGAAAALGLGCRSADPPYPDPPPQPYTALYPGLKAAGPPPEPAVAASSRVRPITATELPDSPSPRPGSPAGPVSPPSPLAGEGWPGAREDTIDLGVALRLAGVDNPTINLSRERIREALADQLAARSLLLPSVNIGGNYHYHEGPLQASFGQIRFVDSQSLYLGFGARTLAAESVAFPGVRLFAHLGDAVYEPLAARQRVAARQSDAQATRNAILLDVSAAYLTLVGAESRLEVLRRGEMDGAEIARLTAVFARAGQGRQSDANRAAGYQDLLRRQVRQVEEDVAVASARLCQLLNLDPSVRLRTPGGAVDLFRLVPEDADIELLVAGAVGSRPEVFARRAEIEEARVRVRQEKVRPFVPVLSAGFSGGLFGGGSNQVASFFGPMTGRTDFDVFAVWNVQNLGFGNVAQVRRTTAVVGEAMAGYDAAVNLVRRQVVEAVAETRAAARQVEIARTALATSAEGYQLELARVKDGQGHPLELLDSFHQLLDARQAFVTAVIAFDIAQFRLFIAVGSDPSSVGPDAALTVPPAQPAPGGPLPAPAPAEPSLIVPLPGAKPDR